MNTLIFGGVNSADYGAFVSVYETFGAPERVVDTVEIPGRNGDFVIDRGKFRNIDVKYSLLFTDATRLEAYRNDILALPGYQRIEDTGHPEEFRIGRVAGGIQPEMAGFYASKGGIAVTFNCKPQRFLKSGERVLEFTAPDEQALRNPTGMPASPLIRVYGTGTLGIGHYSLTVGKHGQAYMDIDCDIGECFCDASNLNGFLTMAGYDFPELAAGTTGVNLGAGIERIQIRPRWWKL